MKNIDLTTGSIWKNLLKLSIPIMLANLMQTFYNLTDTFWLGKLVDGKNMVAVVGMSFPLVFFISSFGIGFSIAGTSLSSQYKGAGQIDQIKKIFAQYIILIFAFSIVFLFSSLFLIDEILSLINTPEHIMSDAALYLSYILPGMIFMFIAMLYQSFSHGFGDTVSPMKIQLISVGINILLDPILIFGIGFIPSMGIRGAAIATLFSRFVAAIIGIIFIFKKLHMIVPKLSEIVPDKEVLKTIIKVSLPSSIGMSMTSFGFVFLQGFVNSYDTVIMSAHTIGNRVTSLFMMPAMGLSQALSSVVGQCLGAKKIERAKKSIKTTFIAIVSFLTPIYVIIFIFGGYFVQFFVNDPEVISKGIRMFKILTVASFSFSLIHIFMGTFNGSGFTKYTMMFNTARLWLFRIPLVYILSGRFLDYSIFASDNFIRYSLKYLAIPLKEHPWEALWWSMVISNLITLFIAILLYKRGKWEKGTIHK
ncbi:MAG: MATE family efflux transporter [Candidatus Delongbacteria bacterium]|jgi:putative MATE family efflux protein|nr:MATE family efflux transporter [Candidatus Delongbacteria bacterium]